MILDRNKIILGIIVLAIIVGFITWERMPSDLQKITEFNKQLVTVNAPLEAGVAKFSYSYKIAMGTNATTAVYFDAINLNLAAKQALSQSRTSLQVPQLRNKAAQIDIQHAHDFFVQYVLAVESMSQSVINIAKQNGFMAKFPPITLPTTNDASTSIEQAYAAVNAKK